ncbi:MAG: 4Fe-4S dicluster domain-containing protein, partial [Deltaproteobacteria bacterium]
MSQGFSILVDTSRCTGCRGCQIACKQWNGLPGTKTKNLGTYQNPQDLSADTWKLVRFTDGKNGNGKPYFIFFTDQCRHCLTPGCMSEAENDEIIQDPKTGAVIFTPKTKDLNFKATREACPFNIPRQNQKTKVLEKCTMCIDRLGTGQIPACVKACPTGTLVFGKRDKILQEVKKRVATLKKTYPEAEALNA